MNWRERFPRKRLVPGVCLAAAALSIPLGVLATGATYAGGDLGAGYVPHLEQIRRGLVEHGTLPRWDFFQYGGTPRAGGLQDGLSFPPILLLRFCSVAALLELIFAAGFACAAFGAYRLIRGYGVRREAAVLGSVAYTLCLPLTAKLAAGHLGPFAVIAHTPLLLALVRTAIRRPSWEKGLLLALGGAWVATIGHPSFLYQFAILAGALALVELRRLSREGRPVGFPLAVVGVAAVAGLLMSAVHFLPALEVTRYATRGGVEAAGIYADRAPDFSFLPRDLTTFWVPLYPRREFIQGDRLEFFWFEKAVYPGILILLGAGVAMLLRPWLPGTRFFAAAALIALLDGMDRHLPFHSLLTAALPGYGWFRISARSVWICAPALSVLGALGWHRWLGQAPEPARRRRTLGILAGAGIAAALVLAIRFGLHGELALLGALLAAACALLALSGRWPLPCAWGAVALTGVELWGQAWLAVPTAPRGAPFQAPWYVQHLAPDRSAYRLLDLTEQGYTPSLHEVRSLSGYSYPLLRSIERLYGDAWEVRPAFNFNGLGTGGRIVRGRELDLLNVGWVLARGEPLEAGQIEVARREEVRLYRRPTARPYAFAGDREAIAERSPNRIRLQVRLPAPETLVVSEAWMPGWRASLDGQPAAVTPFEGALLSVRVPEGEHAVEFVYDSAFSRVGGWVSLLSASAVLVALALLLARKRRSSPAVAAPAGG